MSIVPLNLTDEKNVSGSIKNFISDFKIVALLRKCGGNKLKGIPFLVLFTYVLTNAFRKGSFYMQQHMGALQDSFSKNTYYRFMTNQKMNWLRFTTLLSERIINQHIRPLTSENRADCFVIDDSMYERTGYRRTELVSRVFDHVSMSYRKGFRLMTLGWTDGCSFLPINFSLLASSNAANTLGVCNSFDKRSIAGKRRIMARKKGTTVMVQLLKFALDAGHKAKYVLFDSWFSNPKQIVDIHNLGLDVIAMVKRSSKIRYLFNGESRNIKQIYAASKKRRGRSRYLLSVEVKVLRENTAVDARIVCVRNRSKAKDWLALICTDMSLSEQEIIRIYGKRWDIEVFFKTCKDSLQLSKEYHGLSYDGMTAHVAMVFARYMLLAVAKRDSEDDRTLGELFYIAVAELEDITYSYSMNLLAEAMLSAIQEYLQLSDDKIEDLYKAALQKLPESMQNLLKQAG